MFAKYFRAFGNLVILIGTACTSNSASAAAIEFQLRTYPEGATIIENETAKRYQSPVNLSYTLTERDRDQSGCFNVKGFSAIWESGTQVDSPKLIPLCGVGTIWNYRFDRPTDVPRLDVDLAFEQRLNKQHQQAQSQAVLGYMIGSFLSGFTGGGNRTPVLPLIAPSSPDGTGIAPSSSAPSISGPQLAPDGTYVSGNGPVTLCPNGQYVAGRCELTPSGRYVGQ